MLLLLCLSCIPDVLETWISDRQNQRDIPEYIPAVPAIEGRTYSGVVRAEVYLRPVHPTVEDTLELEVKVYANHSIEVQMPELSETIGGLEVISRTGGGGGSDRYTLFIRDCQLRASASGTYVIPAMPIKYIERFSGEEPKEKSFETSEIRVTVSSTDD